MAKTSEKNNSKETTVSKKGSTAKLRYLKIAPRKTRKVASSIRGLRAVEAEAELLYRPQRAAAPILKLLRSAISNLLNSNEGANKDNLYVSKITVDSGPMMKRMMPRARGRSTLIQKKMSHVSLALSEKDDNIKKRKYKAPTVKSIKSDKKVFSKK